SYVTDGRDTKKVENKATVSGVTVAGQPATIDQNGITVQGSGQGKPVLDALNKSLQQALAASGSKVFLVGANDNPTPRMPCTAGQADGVQAYFQADAQKVPNGSVLFASFLLGSSCTAAAASSDRLGLAADVSLT